MRCLPGQAAPPAAVVLVVVSLSVNRYSSPWRRLASAGLPDLTVNVLAVKPLPSSWSSPCWSSPVAPRFRYDHPERGKVSTLPAIMRQSWRGALLGTLAGCLPSNGFPAVLVVVSTVAPAVVALPAAVAGRLGGRSIGARSTGSPASVDEPCGSTLPGLLLFSSSEP